MPGHGRRYSHLLAPALLVLAATGCGEEEPAPRPGTSTSTSTAAESSPAEPSGEIVRESVSPDGCSFPELRELEEPTFPIVHGEQEREAARGVTFLLTTAEPGTQPAVLELERRVVGCVGTATVEVPAEGTVSTLGLRLRVSDVTAAIDVPNRASVTVTVLDSGQ